jgi:hypothetical protein
LPQISEDRLLVRHVPLCQKEERHPTLTRFGAFPAMTDMIFLPDATIALSPVKRLSLSLSLSLSSGYLLVTSLNTFFNQKNIINLLQRFLLDNRIFFYLYFYFVNGIIFYNIYISRN